VKTREISSPTNTAVKEAAKLKRKRNRQQLRRFLAEGEDLLDAALLGGHIPRQVFVVDAEKNAVADALHAAEARSDASWSPVLNICNQAVMSKLSDLGSGTRIIAVFDFLDRSIEELGCESHEQGPFLYLSGLGDPGNVGTLFRSAAVLGAAGIILSPETADPYGHKAQRAAMGTIFKVPLTTGVDHNSLRKWADGQDVALVCTDMQEGMPAWDAMDSAGKPVLTGRCVLVLGAEREGLPQGLIDAADSVLHIPQTAVAESLNVAMAGTVLLFEALRQRTGVT